MSICTMCLQPLRKGGPFLIRKYCFTFMQSSKRKSRKSLFKRVDGKTSVLKCCVCFFGWLVGWFLSSWFMELKGKKKQWKSCVWILYSEVFTQCRLLVCQTMLALLQFLPNGAPQIVKEPSGKTVCLCYVIPHEQILLRRWSRLHPHPALRQMLPHLMGK